MLHLQMDLKGARLVHPKVSVIMANYNAADYIAAALRSVLSQSLTQIEVLLADDASTDGSIAVARQAASNDRRLCVIKASANGGPAAARNRALDAARGDWIAIVDSDDIIHPHRFALMLAAAAELETDAICDDLTYFAGNEVDRRGTLFGKFRPDAPMALTAAAFVSAAPDAPQLGYLKPLIRRAALNGLRYREDIRIGEDHDFYIRFLLNGGRMHLLPQSYYLYRRHDQSLSHRLHPDDVRAMIAAQDDLLTRYPAIPDDLKAAFALRRAALQEPLAFETVVQHIKCRRYAPALADVIRKPDLVVRLGRVAKSHALRRFRMTKRKSVTGRAPSDWTAQDWAALSAGRPHQ